VKICYVIATWSGKRRNPSTEYLKKHLKRLLELQHSIAKIIVVKPIGSDDERFYDLDQETLAKIEILERPENDRSYGQFLFAYKIYGNKFSHYIIVEDDYIPNLDNFDSILYNMMKEKGCNYLCGKYGRAKRTDPFHPQQNMGIVQAAAFEKILSTDPNPKFYKNGDNDGQEFIMFGNLFANNGLIISDYSDHYSVPYFDRYMRWFTASRSLETLFVPYQLLYHRAFTYDEDTEDSVGDPCSHFLMDMSFNGMKNGMFFSVIIDGQYVGKFVTHRENNLLFIELNLHNEHDGAVLERFVYENRSETVYMRLPSGDPFIHKLKSIKWQTISGDMSTITMKKYYYEQARD